MSMSVSMKGNTMIAAIRNVGLSGRHEPLTVSASAATSTPRDVRKNDAKVTSASDGTTANAVRRMIARPYGKSVRNKLRLRILAA
jgi:hypothetical protein